MGWNSWNTFNCSPSESLLEKTADVMVSSGMAAVGYQYVNIDDCWMSGRDASGNLQWNTTEFPDGIAKLADYVHGKGLKLGIYETPANTTCAGKTGGEGHQTQDANSFASWGVDYLKYDDCGGPLSGFQQMHDALVAAGRPVFYSINPVYGAGSCTPLPSSNCSVPELQYPQHVAHQLRYQCQLGLVHRPHRRRRAASPVCRAGTLERPRYARGGQRDVGG